MVLAIGSFRVSKYAQSAGIGAAGIGIPGTGAGGGIPGMVDPSGNFNLVPGNTYPTTIGPGGEIMPGGGSPFLPGGVPMTPAYGGPGGQVAWDLQQGGFDYGIHEMGPRSGDKLFGSRILNVDLPKMISPGQAFVIIVTYTHDERGETFGSYKIQVKLPALQIVETTPEKRLGAGARDSVPINLTAPSPLPMAPVTGVVELIATEGNDVTIDSEVISIPSETMPNPPMPIPPETPPMPIPPVSEPPMAPPPPPVPLPPVLQQVNVTVTRGQDGGFESIIITASGLEPSEPTTVFIYLSQREGGHGGGREHGNRGGNGQHLGWDKDKMQQWIQNKVQGAGAGGMAVAHATPAGSIATSNVAYASYPSTVSINGMTTNGNGLTLNRNPVMPPMNLPNASSIQALVNLRLKERLQMVPPGSVDAQIQRMSRSLPDAQNLRAQIEAQVQGTIAKAFAQAGMPPPPPMPNLPMPPGMPMPPGGPAGPALPKSFKRQRISITASPEGTLRHVVRVREAQIGQPLFGYVIVYGHRSKKHTGRRQFKI